MLRSKLLDEIPDLSYIFTTRRDGSFRLRDDDAIKKLDDVSRRLKLEDLKAGIAVFGDRVEVLTDKTDVITQGVDGLVSPRPGQGIALTFADCVPTFFACPPRRMVGLLHAGWHNTLTEIDKNVVAAMRRGGAECSSIIAVIGPCICQKHFIVSENIALKFSKYPERINKIGNTKYGNNLKLKHARTLTSIGIKPNNIEIINECTYCLPHRYFSYRRDHYGKKEFPVQARSYWL